MWSPGQKMRKIADTLTAPGIPTEAGRSQRRTHQAAARLSRRGARAHRAGTHHTRPSCNSPLQGRLVTPDPDPRMTAVAAVHAVVVDTMGLYMGHMNRTVAIIMMVVISTDRHASDSATAGRYNRRNEHCKADGTSKHKSLSSWPASLSTSIRFAFRPGQYLGVCHRSPPGAVLSDRAARGHIRPWLAFTTDHRWCPNPSELESA